MPFQETGPRAGLALSSGDSQTPVWIQEALVRKPELMQSLVRFLADSECEAKDDGVVISVPTNFQANGLTPHLTRLEEALERRILGVHIRRARSSPRPALVPSLPANTAPHLQVPLSLTNKRADGPSALEAEKTRRAIPPQLISSPAYAESIELVRRWGRAVDAGAKSQCLWLYGASGSGKTWLLRQLHTLIGYNKKIVAVDIMSFFHEWRRSIESKDQLSFIRKYRKECDLLILENLDDLQGKPGTQQEVLFTVSALLDRGACVAISSQKSPPVCQELIDAALYSRLHSGLALEMPAPDRSFKETLWRHLLDGHGLSDAPIDLVVLERIFAIPVDTARKAHSLFVNAISRVSFKQRLDMTDVSELVSKHSPTPFATVSGTQSPFEFMEKTARVCGLGVAAIQGRMKRPDVCIARRFVCLALSRHLGLTNAMIATLIEKDASTVSHSLKTLEEDLRTNRRVAQQWNYVCDQLGISAQV